MKKILSILSMVALAGGLSAQTSTETLVKDWERAKAFTKEYLDAMPETGYSLSRQ